LILLRQVYVRQVYTRNIGLGPELLMSRLMRLQPSGNHRPLIAPDREIVVWNKNRRGLGLEDRDELLVLQVMFLQPDREAGRVLGEDYIVKKSGTAYLPR
jgi:hypothetical protein